MRHLDKFDADVAVGDRIQFRIREGAYIEGEVTQLLDADPPAITFRTSMTSGLDWWLDRDYDIKNSKTHVVAVRHVRKMSVTK